MIGYPSRFLRHVLYVMIRFLSISSLFLFAKVMIYYECSKKYCFFLVNTCRKHNF